MTPTSEQDSRSCSSERANALGSAWSLDVKRFIGPQNGVEGGDSVPGQEYLAVYLRRRPQQALPGVFAAPQQQQDAAAPLPPSPPLDRRDRTTVAFSIRMCGAPGAVTSNSVCGRSTMGKPFGLELESSWGWETFLSSTSLAERANWQNDSLKFLVTLDLL
jgi:hypothetical protein